MDPKLLSGFPSSYQRSTYKPLLNTKNIISGLPLSHVSGRKRKKVESLARNFLLSILEKYIGRETATSLVLEIKNNPQSPHDSVYVCSYLYVSEYVHMCLHVMSPNDPYNCHSHRTATWHCQPFHSWTALIIGTLSCSRCHQLLLFGVTSAKFAS